MKILESLLITGLVALAACSDATRTAPPPLSDAEREALVGEAGAPLIQDTVDPDD